jgi:hypothetical protein
MKTLIDSKLRIQVDVGSFDNPIDILRGGIPQYWRGNDLRIELGIFAGDDTVDVSVFSEVLLEIRALNSDGEAPSAGTPTLLSGTCTSLHNSVTADGWKSGGTQHAVFTFTAEETNLLPGDYWLSIWAKTDGSDAKVLTLGAGIIHALENGGGLGGTPPEPAAKYYTAAEADSRFLGVDAIDASVDLGTSDDKVPTQNAVKNYVDSNVGTGGGGLNGASNLGDGANIFKEKVSNNLKFRSIKAGSNIDITEGDDVLTISATSGTGSGGHTIQSAGTALPSRENLNFAGALIAADSTSATTVTLNTSSILVPNSNLSDVADPEEALENLGAVPTSTQINGHALTGDVTLTADDIAAGAANKYNIQSDWTASSGSAVILNKPTLASVATSGSYADLTGTPDLGTVAGEDVLPAAKGGTGLTALGSAGQVLKVNSAGNGLEFGAVTQTTYSASNLGEGTGLFSDLTDNTFKFKSIVAGNNIALSSDESSVTITGPSVPQNYYVKLGEATVTTPAWYMTFESIFDATLYLAYVVYFDRVIPAVNNVQLALQFKNGSSVYSVGEQYSVARTMVYGTTPVCDVVSELFMYLTKYGLVASTDETSAAGLTGSLVITGTNSDSIKPRIVGSAIGHIHGAGDPTYCSFAGGFNMLPRYSDGFRLLFTNGRVNEGSAIVFGVKKNG